MMKFKSTILAFTLISLNLSLAGMEQTPAPNTAETESVSWGWLPFVNQAEKGAKNIETVGKGINTVGEGIGKVGEGFNKVADSMSITSKEFKAAVDNAAGTIDKGINTLSSNVREATADFVKATDKLSSEMDVFQKNGVKVAPETIVELNKTGISLMKTYLVAGIGGALALSGIILSFKTLMKSKDDNEQQKPDLRPLYKQIITNRYLISGLLIASGIGVILKSDKIVATIA